MGYSSRSCKELDPTEHVCVTHSAPPGSPFLVGTCVVLQLLLSAIAMGLHLGVTSLENIWKFLLPDPHGQ